MTAFPVLIAPIGRACARERRHGTDGWTAIRAALDVPAPGDGARGASLIAQSAKRWGGAVSTPILLNRGCCQPASRRALSYRDSSSGLGAGQFCPILKTDPIHARLEMNGNELIRRLKRLSRQSGIPVNHDGKPGKGSHGRLYYGSKFTTLKDPRKQIGAGLLNKMLADLGITKDDLNE